MPRNVIELPIEAEEQIDEPRRILPLVERGGQMQRPDPGDRAEPELQHAAPVDPTQRRIGLQPALQLGGDNVYVAAVSCQPRRPAERKPVLMAIELPDDLVIANLGIEVGHSGPEGSRGSAPVHGVEVPVGRATAGEREVAVPEQVVAASHEPFTTADGFIQGVGESVP